MDFPASLQAQIDRIGASHSETCAILYGLPLSTLRGWLYGRRLPDPIKRELVLYRLRQEPPKTPVIRDYRDLPSRPRNS